MEHGNDAMGALKWARTIFMVMEGFLHVPEMKFLDWHHFLALYFSVSENSGFSPQIIHFNRVFHCKPSILGGFSPYF